MMAEDSGYWGGTSTGDAASSDLFEAPYSDDTFSDIWRRLFQLDRTVQGVIGGYANQLEVTNPAGTTIRVATGAALVDGKIYENTANIDFSVTAPGAGSNYYTIVLRKSWAGQTVRAVQLGPDAGSAPSVTQTDGTTWEISIAEVEITSGSVVTVTDTRAYVSTPNTMLVTQRAADGTGDDWGDMAAAAVDVDVREAHIQFGHDMWSGSASTGGGTVDFPENFRGDPLIFLTHRNDPNEAVMLTVTDENGADFDWEFSGGGTMATVTIFWLAIGPRA